MISGIPDGRFVRITVLTVSLKKTRFFGGLGVDFNDVKIRDKFVFRQAVERGIPILMLLSGGYTKESAGLVGESITRLIKYLEENSLPYIDEEKYRLYIKKKKK